MFISTGILVPVMDVVRPHFPYINYVSGLVVLVFKVILVMRFLKVPSNRFIPNSLVLTAGSTPVFAGRTVGTLTRLETAGREHGWAVPDSLDFLKRAEAAAVSAGAMHVGAITGRLW